MTVSEFDQWLNAGINAGYCSPPWCDTHNGPPLTEDEAEAFYDGEDVHCYVLRLLDQP